VDLRRVLVVQEDFAVAGLVRYALAQEGGADVEVVGTGEAALDYVREDPPDLVVVDVALPTESRLDLCRRLRANARGADVPIIVTSARLSEADRVLALDLGADDCLTRPFGLQEFAARARAVSRRRTSRADRLTVYSGARLSADFSRVAITVDEKPVQLTRREFYLLQQLIVNRNRVLTREQLIERLWPDDRNVSPRTVDVHMGRLRAKLGPAGAQIETVFGIGYRFVEGAQ
jgi:DNA-binding response OmpR family regulator